MSELTRRLKETGSAGLLAYGILNTIYYTLAVTVAWISTDGGLRLLPALGQASSGGLAGGVTRFIKVGGCLQDATPLTARPLTLRTAAKACLP
jgi:hypothetical protein